MTERPAISAVVPLTAERWNDLEELFGPERGANSGCWCMWHRLSRRQWDELGRTGRKEAFRDVVAGGPPPGLLGYADARAVAWVAVAPRLAYPRLARLPSATSERPAEWAITWFYVATKWRRRGLMRVLIEAAVRHAAERGARSVEAYPKQPHASNAWGELFVGVVTEFLACGFREVARPSVSRVVVRCDL